MFVGPCIIVVTLACSPDTTPA